MTLKEMEKIERDLSFNIEMIAKKIKSRGIDTEKIDEIVDMGYDFTLNEVKKLDNVDIQDINNIMNLIVLIWMHGSVKSQIQMINKIAIKLDIMPEQIHENMTNDTLNPISR